MKNQRLHDLFNRLSESMQDTYFNVGGIASLERFMALNPAKTSFFITQPAYVSWTEGKEVHTFVAYLLQRKSKLDFVSPALDILFHAIKSEKDILTLGSDFEANYTFIDSTQKGEDYFINNPKLQVCGYYFNTFKLTFRKQTCVNYLS